MHVTVNAITDVFEPYSPYYTYTRIVRTFIRAFFLEAPTYSADTGMKQQMWPGYDLNGLQPTSDTVNTQAAEVCSGMRKHNTKREEVQA